MAAYGSHLVPVVQCQGYRALGWHLKAQASPMATGRQKAPSQRRKQLLLHHGEKETSCGVLLTGLNGGVLSLHPRTHPPGRLWMEGQQQHQAQTPSQSSRRRRKPGFVCNLNLFTIGFQLRWKCCSLPRKPTLCKRIYNLKT